MVGQPGHGVGLAGEQVLLAVGQWDVWPHDLDGDGANQPGSGLAHGSQVNQPEAGDRFVVDRLKLLPDGAPARGVDRIEELGRVLVALEMRNEVARLLKPAFDAAVVVARHLGEKFGGDGDEIFARHVLEARIGFRERLQVLVANALNDRAGGLRPQRGDDKRSLLRAREKGAPASGRLQPAGADMFDCKTRRRRREFCRFRRHVEYPFTTAPAISIHPFANTKKASLKGSETTAGGTIIMPIAIRIEATTMSSTRNGM